MRFARFLLAGLLLAASAFVAASCGSSGTPVTCGGFTCESGKQCCNNCGTPVCSDKCLAIACPSDGGGGVVCGNMTCSAGEQCCPVDCSGTRTCGQACPGILCGDDGGPDATDAASDAPADVAADIAAE